MTSTQEHEGIIRRIKTPSGGMKDAEILYGFRFSEGGKDKFKALAIIDGEVAILTLVRSKDQ